MDKQFWTAILENNYQIPEGYTLSELTGQLFRYIASTDPELRDHIAYSVYATWLQRELYTKEEISEHVELLLDNLGRGIGESKSSSVFLRSFSVLFLAEIVHNDNRKALLERAQIKSILARALWYLDAEKDPRGYVPVKGWAHALAHTADLLAELARHRYVNKNDLRDILRAISAKITHAGEYLYIHGEDERLARAVIEVLRRGRLPTSAVRSWSKSLTAPDGQDWRGAYTDDTRNRAYQNTRNLLRSIYLGLAGSEDAIPQRRSVQDIFFQALKDLKPY